MLLTIYIIGFVFAVLDMAFDTFERADRKVGYIFCILLVLMEKQTYRHTLKSWVYFLNI